MPPKPNAKEVESQIEKDFKLLSAIVKNSKIESIDWVAVGNDIGVTARRGPSERWHSMKRHVPLLRETNIRVTLRRKDEVETQNVAKKDKAVGRKEKGKESKNLNMGGDEDFGVGSLTLSDTPSDEESTEETDDKEAEVEQEQSSSGDDS